MIVLPWPPKQLRQSSDNLHWRARVGPKKKAREDAFEATKAANIARPLPFIGERLPIRVTFYQPTKHKRDDDNMVHSFKHYRDGIAEALGINDRCFAPAYVFPDEIVKGGKITVEIGA